MDLLKDITRELRGGENESSSADGGQSQTTPTARGDSNRRDAPDAAADRSGTPDEPTGDDPSTDQNTEAPDQSTEDVHVCSFCETEFDSSDSVCPECDAEIVLRGER